MNSRLWTDFDKILRRQRHYYVIMFVMFALDHAP